ncbi:uncharacterized protein C2845_PM01G31920 [Panicum miliaceum]|uniref:PB1 domain-containing protein n=1 Tax=Panicum miliaceum TaxID=4540 RepID=A0A3L6TU45_PANMI|nr:uncharacterized protein C2845_PM01G31920 [Panicum miliaceum]
MAAAVSAGGLDARMKLLCSHGGRLARCGGALRYVGGETRVLVVPRAATFRNLAARAAEVAGGAEVRAIRHSLADDDGLEDVLVSVTCDEELAHMRDEYDRLRATRPGARFRVFVTTTADSAGSGGGGVYQQRATAGLPPLAPAMRRVQSERAVLHRRLAYPAPVRRVQSAQEFAGGIHAQQPFHHHRHQQCCCSCRQRRDLCAPAPMPARPMNAVPYMPKKAAAAPSMPAAKAAGRVVFTDAAREKARSREAQAAMGERRAIWEFE